MSFGRPQHHRRHCALALLLVMVLFAGRAWAEENEATAARMRAMFLEVPGQFELRGQSAEDRPFTLIAQPLLNWHNPQRRTFTGAMFLWTNGGRPQAAMCVYPSGPTYLSLEFQSLSPQPLTASEMGRRFWEPTTAGIKFQRLPGATRPGPNRKLRGIQMRAMSREFAATLISPSAEQRTLRLLERPIFTYAGTDRRGRLADGAMFAFVQGTDPEVLLLIEAVKDEQNELQWEFGLARMTMVECLVTRQGATVWRAARASSTTRFSPYFSMRSSERDDAEITTFK